MRKSPFVDMKTLMAINSPTKAEGIKLFKIDCEQSRVEAVISKWHIYYFITNNDNIKCVNVYLTSAIYYI